MINTAHLRQMAALLVVEGQAPTEPAGRDRAAEFRNLCESLPGRIHANGIVRVIAYLENNTNNTEAPKRRVALEALTAWAISSDAPIAWPEGCIQPTLRDRLLNPAAGHTTLRDCQREALRFAEWLKHWAQALLPKKKNESGT